MHCDSTCTWGIAFPLSTNLAGPYSPEWVPAAQVGVGAFVLNENQEVLMVQERNGILKGKVRVRPCLIEGSCVCRCDIDILLSCAEVFDQCTILSSDSCALHRCPHGPES